MFRRILIATACLAPLGLTACGASAHEESGVKAVEAKIDGLTCAGCVAPLTASLHRQFDKAVAVEVDHESDIAKVTFDASQDFSEQGFRDAAAQARMSVVEFQLEACGRIQTEGGERWLNAGSNRFLVRAEGDIPVNVPLCVTATLNATRAQPALEVSSFELQPGAGS